MAYLPITNQIDFAPNEHGKIFGMFRIYIYIRDYTIQLYSGIIISHYKDPYSPTSTVDGRNPAPVDMVNVCKCPNIYMVFYIPGGAGCLPSTMILITAQMSAIPGCSVFCHRGMANNL